ncbi:MAG: response regulator [Spirochaetaceae bacterium]|jgi:DNA-binding response OmpR family regulator|nr:response regulator [Spirochaetaceae bacterium]
MVMQKKIHVLFVDDEKMICIMARDLFEFYGYEVSTYENSNMALEEFRGNPYFFDILVTDQIMPELPGYDLSRRILEIRDNIPVILCTGFTEDSEELFENSIGIDAFFLKPYNFEELIDQIKELV